MKRYYFLFFIVAAFLFVGYKNLPGTMSNGAPEGSTGAPDEKHCSTSGCHSGLPVNSGTAELSVSVGNNITQYEPGKTYPVTISISDPGVVRFGFQFTALKNSDRTNAGTINITDTKHTQSETGNSSGRKYATYTYDGTNAVSAGLDKWNFEWTAPETNAGAITFYVAFVSANNDGTDGGDHTYSKQLTLEAPEISWNVFPTIVNSDFNVQNYGMQIEQLKIFNSNGEKVYAQNNIQPGILNLSLEQPNGIYFLSVSQNGRTDVRKILFVR